MDDVDLVLFLTWLRKRYTLCSWVDTEPGYGADYFAETNATSEEIIVAFHAQRAAADRDS